MMKENQTLTELMVAIRRNTKPSRCIDTYENLILEINNSEVTDVFVSEMSGFLSKLFELFHEVDKLDNLKLKAKILTKDFIKPDSYFRECKYVADRLKRIREAIEAKESLEKINPNYQNVREIEIELGKAKWPSISDFKEVARKTMLLYHYIPAVSKALIQTKRRGLGLDCNSSRF